MGNTAKPVGLLYALMLPVILIGLGFGGWAAGSFLLDQEQTVSKIGLAMMIIIFLLFSFSSIRLSWLFYGYYNETISLQRFVNLSKPDQENTYEAVKFDSLIRRRYDTITDLAARKGELNQGALASITVAQQKAKLTFPRFIQSILILTGVLGTIISLAFSLSGASNLFSMAGDGTGLMDMMGGMASALGTTMAAIVVYGIHSYIFQKLCDLQSWVLQEVERVTLVYILPVYEVSAAGLNRDLTNLVANLTTLVEELRYNFQSATTIQDEVGQVISRNSDDIRRFTLGVDAINNTLKQGFRLDLPPPGNVTE